MTSKGSEDQGKTVSIGINADVDVQVRRTCNKPSKDGSEESGLQGKRAARNQGCKESRLRGNQGCGNQGCEVIRAAGNQGCEESRR
jgi:hypothetical protein